jgi:hypothetical protein
MRVWNLTDGLGLAEAGVEVFEDVDSNQQRAATSRIGIMKVLASYDVILTENKRSLSRQTSVLDFFQLCSKILALPVCCCTLEVMIQGTLLRFKRKFPLLKLFSFRFRT